MEIISGFIIGILGSMHCLGMCGPLVIAVPARKDNRLSTIIDSLLYNSGRIFTYTLLGAIIGLLGASISLAGYQNVISITAGALLLVVVFFPRKLSASLSNIGIINKISTIFKKAFGKIIGQKTIGSIFSLGILNGLLPCGLVYVALTASIASGSVLGSASFMLFFGLGTLPMMASVFVLKSFVSIDFRRKINKLIPVGVTVVALILILRGMSLGIPLISPALPDHVKEKPSCCQHESIK
jgi:sulfite exporter TauE/SafE